MRKNTTKVIDIFPTDLINLSTEEQRVSIAVYRLLAGGRPVSLEKVSSTTDLSPEAVQKIMRHWRSVYYDKSGRIIGYWGLALAKMHHRFEVDGKALFTWCAWDGLFIPAILKSTANITSACPVTGEEIRLTVAPDRLKKSSSRSVFMSFITPEPSGLRENAILNFCHYVYFFSSAAAAAKWSSEHQGTFVLSLDEAFNLAREKNQLQYQDIL
jgi:alkylmercury lyase